MGRPGQPNEVAPAFLFLACEDSSYMTAQVLHPDGCDLKRQPSGLQPTHIEDGGDEIKEFPRTAVDSMHGSDPFRCGVGVPLFQ